MTGIFLLKENDQLIEMTNQEYESEDLLQALLAKYPNLLAGDQMDSESPRRWLLISREAGVPSEEGGSARWAVDHLFLDQDAVPTLVEVKRSSNPGIRREVVGQLLEYAANAVVYWPIESIIAKFEARYEKEGLDPDQVLREFLGDEEQVAGFWEKVKTNLQAEKIRLVFVADEIPAELKRIVEFLNGQMDPAEVLAVEVKQYVGEGHKSLVPRVFGQTEEARQKKSGGHKEKRLWDEFSFFEHARENTDKETYALLRWAYDEILKRGYRVQFGKGNDRGTFHVHSDEINEKSICVFGSLGKLVLYFGNISDSDLAAEFRKELKKIPNFDFADTSYPFVKPEIWGPVIKEILGVFDKIRETYRTSIKL